MEDVWKSSGWFRLPGSGNVGFCLSVCYRNIWDKHSGEAAATSSIPCCTLDCAVVFNLGTFYLRDIRRGFASVLLLQPLGTHHMSCIMGFSQLYIRTQRSRVSKWGILISALNIFTFMVIVCSGHLFTEICNLCFASCVTTSFIALFLITMGLIQLGENKEPTNCLTK